jgi:hypothetical protein
LGAVLESEYAEQMGLGKDSNWLFWTCEKPATSGGNISAVLPQKKRSTVFRIRLQKLVKLFELGTF